MGDEVGKEGRGKENRRQSEVCSESKNEPKRNNSVEFLERNISIFYEPDGSSFSGVAYENAPKKMFFFFLKISIVGGSDIAVRLPDVHFFYGSTAASSDLCPNGFRAVVTARCDPTRSASPEVCLDSLLHFDHC